MVVLAVVLLRVRVAFALVAVGLLVAVVCG